jgi:hypothetical protein
MGCSCRLLVLVTLSVLPSRCAGYCSSYFHGTQKQPNVSLSVAYGLCKLRIRVGVVLLQGSRAKSAYDVFSHLNGKAAQYIVHPNKWQPPFWWRITDALLSCTCFRLCCAWQHKLTEIQIEIACCAKKIAGKLMKRFGKQSAAIINTNTMALISGFKATRQLAS